jgi:hypothetical protein
MTLKDSKAIKLFLLFPFVSATSYHSLRVCEDTLKNVGAPPVSTQKNKYFDLLYFFR